MKECFKCHETLPLSEFYRHPQMADGHLGKCKRCARRDVQDNRVARIEQYRAYDRERYPERYRKGETIAKNAERNMARKITKRHISRGTLIPQPCRVCGAEKVDAHHEDYSKPLEVMWLCRTHHMALHRMDPDRRPTIG